ncbi:MAG TPA: DUF2380 domain-containing protein [Myxococcaceae bacterium]|nr:DUF2380 domain-containing protein [Myxococcaceae bacterium]
MALLLCAASPSQEGTRQAVHRAVDDLKGSTTTSANALGRLARKTAGIGGVNGVFTRYVAYGSDQLPWLRGALGGSTALAETAAQVGNADMELAILRVAGPRLQAASFGNILLAVWVDFLNLADTVLDNCPFYSVERLLVDMKRVQQLVVPSMAALASQDPERVEAAATAMPELMGQLTDEFGALRNGVRRAAEGYQRSMVAAQIVEMITMISAMKMSFSQMPPPPGASVAVGAGALVMESGGVMLGPRIVVSAEWMETVRRLVQAGVITLPVASAALRINAGRLMMAQTGGDLPKGVRDALGDGPEVRGMHETGKAGAGMAEAPRHHVLPQEYRAWFEQRGFKGPMDIDQFCVRMERAQHEAIHGGGDWRLGRTWPEEWNQNVMSELRTIESNKGRMLTPSEILGVVADEMRSYKIPMNFIPGRKG